MRATQALLSLLAKYATFLRYCVVGVMASGVFYGVANLSALLLKQVDSRSEAQSLESSFENAQNAGKLAQDSRGFDKNAELQNNDSTNAARRQDFKTFESNAQNVRESAKDSRISKETSANAERYPLFCDEKCGLQGKSQGSYLDGNDRRDFSPLPHLSRKAESTKEARHSQMATLLGSLASFIFGYFAQMRLAFRAHPNHSTMLPRYIALLVLIAIYAQVITYLGAFFTLPYYAISAFIALSVPLFSYPLQKLWVFAKTSKGGGRLSKDSAFGLESWISSPRFVDRPQVLSSLRGLKSHDSISKILESTFSYNAPTLNKPAKDSRICDEKSWLSRQWQGSYLSGSDHRHCRRIHDLSRKAESTRKWLIGIAPRPYIRPLLFAHSSNNPNIHTPFTAAKLMDCHATAAALARNDRENTYTSTNSARNDKNNPTFQSIASLEKVDSSPKTQPTHHDSKHCGGAVVALRDFGGRARLEVCGCPKNRAINRIAYPRLNRSQRQKTLNLIF